MDVLDSEGRTRKVAVNFSDHCFTKDHEDGIDLGLLYLGSTRRNGGYFCEERYKLSLALPAAILEIRQRKVWNLDHQNYAMLPTVNHRGEDVIYGVFFELNPTIDNPEVDLVLQIRSAHPRYEGRPATHGEVRFAHLVTLRMQGKHAKRFYRNPRKPKSDWKPGQR